MDVLSWSSLLTKGPTRVSRVKTVVKEGGFNQTWIKVWKVLSWSFEALAAGRWPLVDWSGQAFQDKTSVDYLKRGKPLASGFEAMIFVLRADLEFLSNHFNLNHPSSNSPCALCGADRDMSSNPWTDCRSSAKWRSTTWSAAAWAEAHPQRHLFFKIPGCGLDVVFPDLMHTKTLGTDQLLVGAVLTWMVKHVMRGTIAENLAEVWSFIQKWFKDSWGSVLLSFSGTEMWTHEGLKL